MKSARVASPQPAREAAALGTTAAVVATGANTQTRSGFQIEHPRPPRRHLRRRGGRCASRLQRLERLRRIRQDRRHRHIATSPAVSQRHSALHFHRCTPCSSGRPIATAADRCKMAALARRTAHQQRFPEPSSSMSSPICVGCITVAITTSAWSRIRHPYAVGNARIRTGELARRSVRRPARRRRRLPRLIAPCRRLHNPTARTGLRRACARAVRAHRLTQPCVALHLRTSCLRARRGHCERACRV